VHLVSLKVERLLGRFDHEVVFPRDWEFVILHGPNGVGKTKLLELAQRWEAAGCTASSGSRLPRPTFGSMTEPFSASCAQGSSRSCPARRARLSRCAWCCPCGCRAATRRSTTATTQPRQAFRSRLRTLKRELPPERLDQDLWFDYQCEDHVDLRTLRISSDFTRAFARRSGSLNASRASLSGDPSFRQPQAEAAVAGGATFLSNRAEWESCATPCRLRRRFALAPLQ
jgi:hypothetical protein